MAILRQPGAWQWQVVAVGKDGRVSVDFQRWLNALLSNDDFLDNGKQDTDGDLDGISALTGQGLVTRTADDTYAVRSITATSGHLTVTNGNGVAGNINLALPNSGVTAGSYTNANITVDAQGRVTVAANGSAGTSYTNEEAQDAVGTILVDSATIDFTYDDATPSITAIVKADSIGPTQLIDTAVSAGTYGDDSNVAQFTVDAQGRITAASNVAISGGGGGGYRPVVDGSSPPVFILNDDHDLIMTEI